MYYDQGWNDYINGIAYDISKSLDWKDGWKDCQEATAAYGKQKKI